MSNEGFRGVPGVPDGWELVAIRPAMPADWFVSRDGKAEQWRMSWKSKLIHAIIRKIEQPAKYRAFENGKEAEPFFDCKLRHKDNGFRLLRIVEINESLITFSVYTRTYAYVFENYVFADGTPFGVRIDD